jgi:hypothetical protein
MLKLLTSPLSGQKKRSFELGCTLPRCVRAGCCVHQRIHSAIAAKGKANATAKFVREAPKGTKRRPDIGVPFPESSGTGRVDYPLYAHPGESWQRKISRAHIAIDADARVTETFWALCRDPTNVVLRARLEPAISHTVKSPPLALPASGSILRRGWDIDWHTNMSSRGKIFWD